MNIVELINRLQNIERENGNLEVLGGVLHDDSGLSEVFVLDAEGADVAHSNGTPAGVFFE